MLETPELVANIRCEQRTLLSFWKTVTCVSASGCSLAHTTTTPPSNPLPIVADMMCNTAFCLFRKVTGLSSSWTAVWASPVASVQVFFSLGYVLSRLLSQGLLLDDRVYASRLAQLYEASKHVICSLTQLADEQSIAPEPIMSYVVCTQCRCWLVAGLRSRGWQSCMRHSGV